MSLFQRVRTENDAAGVVGLPQIVDDVRGEIVFLFAGGRNVEQIADEFQIFGSHPIDID